MDDVHLENHVIIHEVGKGDLAGDDDTYLSGSQKYVLRPSPLQRRPRYYLDG